MSEAVLLLNSTYEPLNVINIRRAFRLLFTAKASALEGNGRIMHYGRGSVKVPEVIKLGYYVKRPLQRVRFTKTAIFLRDNFTCQYCGDRTRDLTVDHVVPKTRGGLTTWTNCVAACKRCNNAKGDTSLKESGLKLRRQPKEPKFLPYLRMIRHAHHQSWDKYLFLEGGDSQYLVREDLPTK